MKFLVSALALTVSEASWTIEHGRYGPAYDEKDDYACPTCHYDPVTKHTTVNYASTSPNHEHFHCHRANWVDGYGRKQYPTENVACHCSCHEDEAGFGYKDGGGRTLGGSYGSEYRQKLVDLDGVGFNTDFEDSGEPAVPDLGFPSVSAVNDSPFGYCTDKEGNVVDAHNTQRGSSAWRRASSLQECLNDHNMGSGGAMFNPNIPDGRNNCLLCPFGYGYTTPFADYDGDPNSFEQLNYAETGDARISDPALRASWQHAQYPWVWKCSGFDNASCERKDGGKNRYGEQVSAQSQVTVKIQWFDVASEAACSDACRESVQHRRELYGARSNDVDYCCAYFPDDDDSNGNCHVKIARDSYPYLTGRDWNFNMDPAAADNYGRMPTPTYYQDALALSKYWFCARNEDGYSQNENNICSQNGNEWSCGNGSPDTPYCGWRGYAADINAIDAFSRKANFDGPWVIPYGWWGKSNDGIAYSDSNQPPWYGNNAGYIDKLRMPAHGGDTIKAKSCIGMPIAIQLVFFEGLTWPGVNPQPYAK